ncbi:MAG TPA: hypothetical protein VGM17_16830, partial [Rhizomicrobium sp.]
MKRADSRLIFVACGGLCLVTAAVVPGYATSVTHVMDAPQNEVCVPDVETPDQRIVDRDAMLDWLDINSHLYIHKTRSGSGSKFDPVAVFA